MENLNTQEFAPEQTQDNLTEALGIDINSFEEGLSEVEGVDEFTGSVDFDKFIALPKKSLVYLCRIVEPLTKSSIDAYGKSVHFHCLSNDEVEISYLNTPFRIKFTIPNKSNKQVRDFSVSLQNLKRLAMQSFATLILVEEGEEICVGLCESLLYLATTPLNHEEFCFDKHETPLTLDKEASLYAFRQASKCLGIATRAAERVAIVKNNQVYYNTGVFAASCRSPFTGDSTFVIYKQVVDIIALVSELSTADINYYQEGESLYISTPEIYLELVVGDESKANEFFTPTLQSNLSFNATASILNDNLYRILSVVASLDYLSDIVDLEVNPKELILKINNKGMTKSSEYKFNIIEGTITQPGSLKVAIPVLRCFLVALGTEALYDCTEAGLAVQTPNSKFLIRRT